MNISERNLNKRMNYVTAQLQLLLKKEIERNKELDKERVERQEREAVQEAKLEQERQEREAVQEAKLEQERVERQEREAVQEAKQQNELNVLSKNEPNAKNERQ